MSTVPAVEIPENPTATEEVLFPPSDLWSDEPPLELDLHREQIDLLIRLLKGWWQDRQNFYASGNLTIYYSPNQLKSEFFRGPDFFVVLGTEKKDRRSWVVWQENGKYPNLIVELLSNSTADVDRGLKKEIYQDTFRTPEYFWFHPETLEFKGFELIAGQYQELQPDGNGRLWSQQLELSLGIHESQLRLFTTEGQLVPMPEERAEQERQRADQEKQRADQAEALLAQYQERFGELSE
jgi:Uma2 family endonuclease